MISSEPKPRRRSLFRKYFLVLFAAVVVPLLVSGGSEAWFGYRDQRATLAQLLAAEARGGGSKIAGFLEEIKGQLGWLVQFPAAPGTEERERLDASRLLRQVPAIVNVTLVDGAGKERLHVSRVGLNRIASGIDRSGEPAVIGARASRLWYGPVFLNRESEPFMTIALAGNRAAVGIVIAEINLKLIWDVVTAIRVGETGYAFILDKGGQLIAHPEMTMVLRGANDATLKPLQDLRSAILTRGGVATTGTDATGQTVIAATASILGVDWSVIVTEPLAEAYGPIYAALWRTGILLLAGAALAVLLAYWLASRMIDPIHLLEEGVEKIGAGEFDHRIAMNTGDEFEHLADQFNKMAGELAVSQERADRINRLSRFLAPQVAELLGKGQHSTMLDTQRREVVAVFCDLRGFTAFSSKAGPDEIMSVLGEYYRALGSILMKYEATQTSFLGDGMMLLLNAPLPCPDPAVRGVNMAIDMQDAVQTLVVDWRARGYRIGFGMGLAQGPATVGQIGYENRLDYTAIGSVVNLASRLCAAATDGQILIDPVLAAAVSSNASVIAVGSQHLKGFDDGISVYAVQREDIQVARTPSPVA
jgi:class 3 adenylate cyclase